MNQDSADNHETGRSKPRAAPELSDEQKVKLVSKRTPAGQMDGDLSSDEDFENLRRNGKLVSMAAGNSQRRIRLTRKGNIL